jgi:hypothetical protein
LVVDDGGFDTLPDYSTLLDCCPLCCRPSEFPFADYLQVPSDPQLDNPQPECSSTTDLSWASSQAEIEPGEPDLNKLFFGTESSHRDANFEAYNSSQPPGWILFDGDNVCIPDFNTEPPANEGFEPLEMNVPAMVHSSQTYEPQPVNEQPELDAVATMEELEQLPLIPTATHTSERPLVCELVRMEDIQPQPVIIFPDNLALPVLDEVHQQLRPSSEKFICLWRGCEASFKKMGEFRHVISASWVIYMLIFETLDSTSVRTQQRHRGACGLHVKGFPS